MNRARSKTYGGKNNKQYCFEKLYEAHPDLSNQEIADILSYDTGETPVEHVEKMKSRYKAKLKAKLKSNDAYNRAINKIIKDEDVIQKYYKILFNQSENIAETKFQKEEIKLEVFKKLMDVMS